ncbi:MAG: endonuclease MutS2 [Clostridia bacterium]|nr:endonuclease MutS2 [Clostridia bacterium]
MKGFTKAKTILEYDKIIGYASSFATTAAARKKLAETIPETDSVIISRLLDETEQALDLLVMKGKPGFSAPEGVVDSADRAEKGATLTPIELINIASMLRAVGSVKKYPEGKEIPALYPYFSSLTESRALAEEIDMKIIGEDTIADDASPELYRIRRDIRRAEDSVRTILSNLTTGENSKYLRDAVVTIRSGRYVIPVRSEHKNEIKGLVHDSSASGQTLFIEPMAVIEANNKLRELKGRETEEIEKILSELSVKVAGIANIIRVDFKVITDLDVIFARASYSSDISGIRPKTNASSIRLVRARHPLIPKSKVVPISVEFGERDNALIITGPNTGGKTVTLKTLGLLALMAQSGLYIPADDGSTLPTFNGVLADIGDEQSIEQSLSTFSSHMVNVVSILKECGKGTLVLFDELGAGTDPTEGASLAIAILERVRASGAIVAATTHYSEIKIYALDTEGVLNASCEFDLATLKPTYRLITGIPGRSNAFEISLRLGMDESVIARAKELLAEDNIRFEDVIVRLEETEQDLRKERSESERARAEALKIRAEAEKQAKEMQERAEAELDRARAQAQRILDAAKKTSNQVFEELNELKKADAKRLELARIEEARKAVRQNLKDTSAAISDIEEFEVEEDNYTLPRPLQIGDKVLLADIGKEAVVKSISGDTVFCAMGRLETKTNIKNIRLLANAAAVEKQKKEKGRAQYTHSVSAVKNEIDVRGNTGDDAWFIIDRYLEDAILAGHETVYVIHGKGTGALRAALWQFFRQDKARIRSFRSGRYGEGDLGVTVLELKIKK